VFNTSAFDVSRNNVATAVTLNGVESVVFDSQKTKGVEAAADAKLNDQWHVLANVTCQDAYITDNPQGISSVGNHPQGVPAVLANLWTSYLFSIAGLSGFHIGGGLNYQRRATATSPMSTRSRLSDRKPSVWLRHQELGARRQCP
jgi:iron complex outermembrane recepter protein